MNESSLKKLSKSQLIKLLLQQNAELQSRKPAPKPRTNLKQMIQSYEDNIIKPPMEFSDDYKPIPAPRKSVKQMVQDYEDNIILPPLEFRDDYKPIPLPRTTKPTLLPRTKIEQVAKALKGYTESYEKTKTKMTR